MRYKRKKRFYKKGDKLKLIRPFTTYDYSYRKISFNPEIEFRVEEILDDGYKLKTNEFYEVILVPNADINEYFEFLENKTIFLNKRKKSKNSIYK